MNFFERYLALARVYPFSEIPAGDAAAIAGECFPHFFEPGSVIAEAGGHAAHLFICVGGGVEHDGGGAARPVFPAEALLLSGPHPETVRAGRAEGALCLVLAREKFLSAARGCPAILALMARAERGAE